ncbi:MAG: hypothetical protein PUB21_06940 [Bacteroidales bacterium]|nr:hypothetical protein [Bacteroidales bacterium]
MEKNNQLIHGDEAHLIDAKKIREATEKMVEMLGLAAGSTEGFDLYKVMETYFKDLDKRYEINKCLGIPEGCSYYMKEKIEEEVKSE